MMYKIVGTVDHFFDWKVGTVYHFSGSGLWRMMRRAACESVITCNGIKVFTDNGRIAEMLIIWFRH